MTNRNRRLMDILTNQAQIATVGDLNMDLSWDPNQTGHRRLWRQLGSRVTEIAFLYFLCEKPLPISTLASQQSDDLCNNGAEIQVTGFDEGGRQRELTLLKRTQESNANRWSACDVIKIWGLPYAGREDQWCFGPDHDFSDITFVSSTTV